MTDLVLYNNKKYKLSAITTFSHETDGPYFTIPGSKFILWGEDIYLSLFNLTFECSINSIEGFFLFLIEYIYALGV